MTTIQQIITFLQENWGKLSAVALTLFHAIMLHKDQIAALNAYAVRNGGILRVLGQFFWVPQPKTLTAEDAVARAKAQLAVIPPISPATPPADAPKTP